MSKRVVVQELSGLWRIIGEVEGKPPELIALQPDSLPLSLIRVKPRYVLYKEIMEREAGRFNDTFDPKQV